MGSRDRMLLRILPLPAPNSPLPALTNCRVTERPQVA